MDDFIRVFAILILFYFITAIVGIISIYLQKKTWTSEFKERWDDYSFRIIFFFYYPITLIRRIIN